MTDNGLAALAAALGEYKAGIIGTFSIPQSAAPRWDDRSIEDREAWITGATDDAAAILGERGVFLLDGTCGHEEEYLGYWRATNEALATIAALRGLDSAVATLGELNAIVAAERERIKAEVKALPTLVLPTGTYVDVEDVFDAVTEP